MNFTVETRNKEGKLQSFSFAKRINAFQFAYKTAEIRDITHVYLSIAGEEPIHRIKEPSSGFILQRESVS